MPTFRITIIPGGSRIAAALILVVLLALAAALIGIPALFGALLGTRLTEAEASIRGHLMAQAGSRFQKAPAQATSEARAALLARYSEEIDRLKAVQFDSVDVGTSIFSTFSIRRSFVVKVVMHGKDQPPSTHRFCFVGKYLTSECLKGHWYLAW